MVRKEVEIVPRVGEDYCMPLPLKDVEMAEVMLTIVREGETPSLESVAQMLHVPKAALNAEFGVVLIDPSDTKYAVLIDESYASNVSGPNVKGPFSNPRIAHYGLVR